MKTSNQFKQPPKTFRTIHSPNTCLLRAFTECSGASVHRQTEATPEPTPLKAKTPSLVLLPASATRPLVLKHSLSTQLAAATRPAGFQALHANTEGRLNTAIGYQALYLNGTGEGNTATGYKALIVNATGVNNTANGVDALGNNTTGDNNTATGNDALFSNTTGNNNTSNGANALESNTTGSRNAANGFNALQHNTTGDANVALGSFAGRNATTGDGNVYIGSGMDGVVGEANHTYIRNINSTPVSGGGTRKVTVDLATGLIGHETSSRRYKQDIKPMDNTSQALFGLKPVTYRYKERD